MLKKWISVLCFFLTSDKALEHVCVAMVFSLSTSVDIGEKGELL